MKVPSYNKENRKTNNSYETLPKGNYVCKIMKAEEHTSKEGKISIKLSFDIAEGEYKDFYAKKYQEDTREDKKWSRDAEYYISIPTDESSDFIKTKYDTFFANLEDSNNGYVFQGNLDELKGKILGQSCSLSRMSTMDGFMIIPRFSTLALRRMSGMERSVLFQRTRWWAAALLMNLLPWLPDHPKTFPSDGSV